MRRATTPVIDIAIDTDLSDCWYRVAFKQNGGIILIKTNDDCVLKNDGRTIEVPLTQEETISFNENKPLLVQVRYGKNGYVFATNIVTIDVEKVLDDEVVGQ